MLNIMSQRQDPEILIFYKSIRGAESEPVSPGVVAASQESESIKLSRLRSRNVLFESDTIRLCRGEFACTFWKYSVQTSFFSIQEVYTYTYQPGWGSHDLQRRTQKVKRGHAP